ncbi:MULTISPECIES: ribosome maturation factor RimM [Clostridium]|uniref:ribosome maturation factor RimM n=1 Tax=Clostridium TaxID=1485 RepID=UPI00069EC983|nr:MULTISPECIES: ribosome maturation factor RimM [Clostridium]KOF58143.1 16S rRNA processing protein RimM [Clostridium sp. DMHC 10]MCD2345993.1 ribosome maturation factor RimM [Clostridium guangxiense]
MTEFFNVGQIINTHGVKGEVKVYPLTDDIKRFRKLREVYIDDEVKKIKWCKIQPDKVILKLDGIESMEEAFKLKNKYIRVPREQAAELKEGQYFIADIKGCSVFDENEEYLGKVYDVISTKNNDVYWVKRKDMEDLLIPVLKNIIVSIDINNSKIVIRAVDTWKES